MQAGMDSSVYCFCSCFAAAPNLYSVQHILATLGAERLLQTGYAKQLHLLKDNLQASFCPTVVTAAYQDLSVLCLSDKLTRASE